MDTSSYCRTCASKRQNAYNKKNKYKYSKSTSLRKREFIIKAKSKPCADCNVVYPWYVMDFDHLGDKKFNISTAVNKNLSYKKIEEEIAKCEVVCSNCHRVRTHTRRCEKLNPG